MYESREGTPVLPSHHPLSPIFTLFRQLINRMIDLSADTGRGPTQAEVQLDAAGNRDGGFWFYCDMS